MNIFNSLGSNYTFKTAFSSLFSFGTKKDRKNLIDLLAQKYPSLTEHSKTEVHLLYKGRQAIEAGVKICNFPSGSEVVISGFTCKVVKTAVENAGLSVVCLDPDPKRLNFTSRNLENVLKINKKIKAVIVQHTLGIKAEIEKIAKICKDNNLVLIEDLAHTTEEGKYGDFVTLTFSQDKIIDSVSGGALIIRNKNYKNKFKLKLSKITAMQQLKDRFYPVLTYIIRKTYKLGIGKVSHYLLKQTKLLSDPIGPSISLSLLPNWYSKVALNYFTENDKDILHRKKIVSIYKRNLNKQVQFKGNPLIRFPIFIEQKKELIQILKRNGIHVSDIWYDNPVVESDISKNILNLPTHKNTNQAEALKITKIINEWINTL